MQWICAMFGWFSDASTFVSRSTVQEVAVLREGGW
jgi:hypothetical protein